MAHPTLRSIRIPVASFHLEGDLAVPSQARGIVLFAHGSGSGRFSPRNQFVARALQQAGLGTLLIDLLSEEEANDRAKVFDIPLLGERLHAAARWLHQEVATRHLGLGLFGASTGGGAALVCAAQYPEMVQAVVSRGGRPDLAGPRLQKVKAPTLLIVGGWDGPVIDLNQQAQKQLPCQNQLIIVPEATHLFEEPGKLEEVARLATDWFLRYLSPKGEG